MRRELNVLLATIGQDLSAERQIRVYDRGVVRPSSPADHPQQQGTEMTNGEGWKQTGSAAGSWEGPSGGQRAAGGPRPSGYTAPVFDPSVQREYEAELNDVRSAYPGTKVWFKGKGMWLLTDSQVLPGLTKKATFLTAIPFMHGSRAIAWAYWTTGLSASWIGPRHTNFPDGSICAFEPKDETWVVGDNIVKLLDLYTVWVLRHLHLEVFGWWPGFQSVAIPYERLQELKDNEFCGCDHSTRRYSDCCKPGDLLLDRQKAFLEFFEFAKGALVRKPPAWVLPTILGVEAPPKLFS